MRILFVTLVISIVFFNTLKASGIGYDWYSESSYGEISHEYKDETSFKEVLYTREQRFNKLVKLATKLLTEITPSYNSILSLAKEIEEDIEYHQEISSHRFNYKLRSISFFIKFYKLLNRFEGDLRVSLNNIYIGQLPIDIMNNYLKNLKILIGKFEKSLRYTKLHLDEDVLSSKVNKQLNRLSTEFLKAAKKPVKLQIPHGGKDGAIDLIFDTTNEACFTVTSPGEIILRKALLTDNDPIIDDFGETTLKWIKIKELATFNRVDLRYRHAEIITGLTSYTDIETISYYPWPFNLKKPASERKPMFLHITSSEFSKYYIYNNYRTSYSIYRVKALTKWGEVKRREAALIRTAARFFYPRLGVCSDFINWTYFNVITSNWNKIPIIKWLVQLVYLPEGLQTPDNLADSYMTKKVCEVKNSKLLYPRKKDVGEWVSRLEVELNSNSSRIKDHAKKIVKYLQKNRVIDLELNPLIKFVNLKTRSELYESN